MSGHNILKSLENKINRTLFIAPLAEHLEGIDLLFPLKHCVVASTPSRLSKRFAMQYVHELRTGLRICDFNNFHTTPVFKKEIEKHLPHVDHIWGFSSWPWLTDMVLFNKYVLGLNYYMYSYISSKIHQDPSQAGNKSQLQEETF